MIFCNIQPKDSIFHDSIFIFIFKDEIRLIETLYYVLFGQNWQLTPIGKLYS